MLDFLEGISSTSGSIIDTIGLGEDPLDSFSGADSFCSVECSFSVQGGEGNSLSLFGEASVDNLSGNISEQDLSFSESVTSFAENMLQTDSEGLLSPYDDSQTTNLLHRLKDPFGIYAIKNTYGYIGLPDNISYGPIELPENFTENDIQSVCDTICDTLNWPHLPVRITDLVPNAAYFPGFFTHSTFDDSLCLNPQYAHECIEHIGSTDIIISDLAHEIGHSIAMNICGDMGTYLNEKIADFIAGFVCGKCGIDIDVARKWFEWYYDPVGVSGYPISEDRWDAQAAGYYFSHLANADDLQAALRDPNFLDIVEAYQHDRLEIVNEMAWQQAPYTQTTIFERIVDYGKVFLAQITDLTNHYHFMPIVARWLTRMHVPV